MGSETLRLFYYYYYHFDYYAVDCCYWVLLLFIYYFYYNFISLLLLQVAWDSTVLINTYVFNSASITNLFGWIMEPNVSCMALGILVVGTYRCYVIIAVLFFVPQHNWRHISSGIDYEHMLFVATVVKIPLVSSSACRDMITSRLMPS